MLNSAWPDADALRFDYKQTLFIEMDDDEAHNSWVPVPVPDSYDMRNNNDDDNSLVVIKCMLCFVYCG